jgi:hypothetical protein
MEKVAGRERERVIHQDGRKCLWIAMGTLVWPNGNNNYSPTSTLLSQATQKVTGFYFVLFHVCHFSRLGGTMPIYGSSAGIKLHDNIVNMLTKNQGYHPLCLCLTKHMEEIYPL